jgi:hypothetical protein
MLFVPRRGDVVVQVDLSAAERQDAALVQFSLAEPGRAGIFLHIKDLDIAHLEILLQSPGDARRMLLAGRDYCARLDTMFFDEELPAGVYRVAITHPVAQRRVEVYLREG